VQTRPRILDSDITKQISTVSLDQHWKILPLVMQCYPRAFGQHYITSGQNFSVLTSAPVNICIMMMTMCLLLIQNTSFFILTISPHLWH